MSRVLRLDLWVFNPTVVVGSGYPKDSCETTFPGDRWWQAPLVRRRQSLTLSSAAFTSPCP